MISGYCWPQSARAGEQIALMVSSNAPACTVDIIRIGAEAVPVARSEEVVDRALGDSR